MAFSNIDTLALGNLLQIVFSDGVRNQISQDYRDWEYISRHRYGNSAARELRFLFQDNYGPAAVQYRDPGTSGRAFPDSHQSSIQEYTAKFKELNTTIDIEYNLWDRARKSPEKYGEPLALEIQSKTTAAKRRLASDLYGDGSGVVGTLNASAAAVTSPASDKLVFTISNDNDDRGHVGHFEYGDILILREPDATASALDTSLATEPVYWKVISKDRRNSTVTLQGLNSSFASAGSITSITTQPGADEVFYRYGQPTIPDLTAISDYGTATEVIAGLESLTQNDGRVIHGITMEGATAGTRTDAGGNPIDVKYVQQALDLVKVAVGQDAYSWKMMCMAPETHAAFIESRETDRRFNSIEDNKRGIRFFAYMHGNDAVETYSSEFVPQKRIYMLPESRGEGKKVLEFWGSDFEPVRGPQMDAYHLKPSSAGGHVNNIVSYLQSIGVIVCKHPASIAVVENFTNS